MRHPEWIEVDRLERERANLLAVLNDALKLTDAMLDEILTLHKHASQPLPLKLLAAKEQFDKSMKKLTQMGNET